MRTSFLLVMSIFLVNMALAGDDPFAPSGKYKAHYLVSHKRHSITDVRTIVDVNTGKREGTVFHPIAGKFSSAIDLKDSNGKYAGSSLVLMRSKIPTFAKETCILDKDGKELAFVVKDTWNPAAAPEQLKHLHLDMDDNNILNLMSPAQKGKVRQLIGYCYMKRVSQGTRMEVIDPTGKLLAEIIEDPKSSAGSWDIFVYDQSKVSNKMLFLLMAQLKTAKERKIDQTVAEGMVPVTAILHRARDAAKRSVDENKEFTKGLVQRESKAAY